MRSNIISQKMTRNSLLRTTATEAAEATLLEAEQLLSSSSRAIISAILNNSTPTLRASQCSATLYRRGGLCVPIEHSSNPSLKGFHPHWKDIRGDSKSLNVWAHATLHRIASNSIKNRFKLNSNPKYIIEFLGFIASQYGSNCQDDDPAAASWPYCHHDPAMFRITALASSGNSDQTRVMLQSNYIAN